MTFADKVKALGLPLNEIIVIGSGIMEQLNIRASNDIDLCVTDAVAQKLKQAGWESKIHDEGIEYLFIDDAEATTNWDKATFAELMEDSVNIDGVNFITLERLAAWKKCKDREKDRRDIKLIEAYLTKH